MARARAERQREPAQKAVPRWSQAELRVVGRYVQALVGGRYRRVVDAAEACRRELGRLRRPGSASARHETAGSRSAVYALVGKLARESGRVACQNPWTAREMKVLRRHARALAQRHYCDARQATAFCQQEMASLHLADPRSYGPRSQVAVRKLLRPLARKLGWPGAHCQLHPIEERLLERYARGLIRGGFGSAREAATACRQELARLRQGIPALRPKTLPTLRTYIHRRSRGLGVRRLAPAWTPAEDRLVAPYVRALVEGRYRTATRAAEACIADWARRGMTTGRGMRTSQNVARRIDELTRRLGMSRPNGRWSADEKRILLRFAQAVVAGRYAGPTPALEPCFAALNRHYNRLRVSSPLPLRAVGGRTRAAVFRRLSLHVRKQGWHGRPNPRWTAEENRVCQGWVRWYGKHRRGSRGPIAQAAEGLQEELAQIGASRSVAACKHHVRQKFLALHGPA